MTAQASVSRLKKRYSTLSGLLCITVFKLVLLSFLAWLLLVMWFGGVTIDKGINVALQDIHGLDKSYVEWIANKHLAICHASLSMIGLIKYQIQDHTHRALDSLASFLQKINQSTLLNRQSVLVIMTGLIEATEVVVFRLFIFILSMPLWASILFVMVVDGLVQRDIRKFQAARESTFLFHRLKLLTSHVFYSLFLLYMSMPWAIQPQTLLVPMILIVSVLVMLTIKYYKKHV